MTATFSKLLRNPSHLPSCQRSAAPPRPAEPSSGVGPLSSPPIDSATGGTPDHHKVKVIGWMSLPSDRSRCHRRGSVCFLSPRISSFLPSWTFFCRLRGRNGEVKTRRSRTAVADCPLTKTFLKLTENYRSSCSSLKGKKQFYSCSIRLYLHGVFFHNQDNL